MLWLMWGERIGQLVNLNGGTGVGRWGGVFGAFFNFNMPFAEKCRHSIGPYAHGVSYYAATFILPVFREQHEKV